MGACHLTRRKRGRTKHTGCGAGLSGTPCSGNARRRRRPGRGRVLSSLSAWSPPCLRHVSEPRRGRWAGCRPDSRAAFRLTPASPRAVRWPRRSLEVRRSSSPSRRPSARARRGHGHPCRRSGVPGASPGRRRARGAATGVVPGLAGSPDSGPDRTAISCRRARVVGPDIWPMGLEKPGSRTHGGNRSRTPGDRDSLVAGRARARNATHRPDPCRGRR